VPAPALEGQLRRMQAAAVEIRGEGLAPPGSRSRSNGWQSGGAVSPSTRTAR